MTTYAVLTTILKVDDDRDLKELTPRMVQAIGRYKGVQVLSGKLGGIRDVKGKPCEAGMAGTAVEIAKLAVHQLATDGHLRKRQPTS